MEEVKEKETGVLYCYRLDESTGEIFRYTIDPDQWVLTKHVWNTDRDTFSFYADIGGGKCYRYNFLRHNLDKFVSHKVYTFDPDKDNVKKIIVDYLDSKLTSAQNEVSRWTSVLRKIHKLDSEVREETNEYLL